MFIFNYWDDHTFFDTYLYFQTHCVLFSLHISGTVVSTFLSWTTVPFLGGRHFRGLAYAWKQYLEYSIQEMFNKYLIYLSTHLFFNTNLLNTYYVIIWGLIWYFHFWKYCPNLFEIYAFIYNCQFLIIYNCLWCTCHSLNQKHLFVTLILWFGCFL